MLGKLSYSENVGGWRRLTEQARALSGPRRLPRIQLMAPAVDHARLPVLSSVLIRRHPAMPRRLRQDRRRRSECDEFKHNSAEPKNPSRSRDLQLPASAVSIMGRPHFGSHAPISHRRPEIDAARTGCGLAAWRGVPGGRRQRSSGAAEYSALNSSHQMTTEPNFDRSTSPAIS